MKKNKKERTIELLDDAYKTCNMGTFALDCLMDKIESAKLKELLKKQNSFYQESTKAIESIAPKFNHEVSDINIFAKGMSSMSIDMKTLVNKETSHISQMLIDGTTMGITTMIKERNSNNDLDPELLGIVDKMVSNLEQFVESLKEFL